MHIAVASSIGRPLLYTYTSPIQALSLHIFRSNKISNMMSPPFYDSATWAKCGPTKKWLPLKRFFSSLRRTLPPILAYLNPRGPWRPLHCHPPVSIAWLLTIYRPSPAKCSHKISAHARPLLTVPLPQRLLFSLSTQKPCKKSKTKLAIECLQSCDPFSSKEFSSFFIQSRHEN